MSDEIRYHWYAGASWTILQRLIARAQKDADRTLTRQMVHADHDHGEPCGRECVLIVPTPWRDAEA